MEFNQFKLMMTSIIKPYDNALKVQYTTMYFEYIKQFPDNYIQNMIQLFQCGDQDEIAFCATIIRKNLIIKGQESIIYLCKDKNLCNQLLHSCLNLLLNKSSYSKIMADLCGEIGINLIRIEQDISVLIEFIQQALSSNMIVEVSIIVWSLTNSKWRYISQFILQYIAILCESNNPDANSYAFLSIGNLLMGAQYAHDEEDSIEYDLQQQLISGLFQIIQKLLQSALTHKNSFKQAMECFVEMIDCMPELFVDYIDQIFEFLKTILTTNDIDEQINLVGINILSSVVGQSEQLFCDEAYYEQAKDLLILNVYPKLNNLTEEDIYNLQQYQKIDLNSTFQAISDNIFQMFLGQVTEIAIPTINKYIELYSNQMDKQLSIIEIIRQLFYTEQFTDNQDNYIQLLFSYLKLDSNIIRYWVFYTLKSVVLCLENNKQGLTNLFETLQQYIEQIIMSESYVQITFIDLINDIIQQIPLFSKQSQQFISQFVQHFSMIDNITIKTIILKIVTIIYDQKLIEQNELIQYQEIYYKQFFEIANQIIGYKENRLLVQYFSQLVESCALFYCNQSSQEVKNFITIIFDLLQHQQIDEIHQLIDSIIVCITQLLTKYSTLFTQQQVDISFKLFLQILSTPLFEHQENTFDDNQKCNSFILKQQKLVFNAIYFMFQEIPIYCVQHFYNIKLALDSFNYIRQYQFINIAKCYASMLFVSKDEITKNQIVSVFDSALQPNTRRTVAEIVDIFKSLIILQNAVVNQNYQNQVLEKIILWSFNVMQMANKSFNKYLDYSSNYESEICCQQNLLIYEGQICLQQLYCNIQQHINLVEVVQEHLFGQDNLESYAFVGVLAYYLIQQEVDIQQIQPILFLQLVQPIPRDFIYVCLTQLILQSKYEIDQLPLLQLHQNYKQNHNFGLGILLLLTSYKLNLANIIEEVQNELLQQGAYDKLLFQVIYYIIISSNQSNIIINSLLINSYFSQNVHEQLQENIEVTSFMEVFVNQHSHECAQFISNIK